MSRLHAIRKPNARAVWNHTNSAIRSVLVPPSTRDERNTYFLYMEVIFASLLSAAANFNSTFIIRLGGSNTLVGLLSSLPALVAVLAFMPSARLLERLKEIKSCVVWSVLLARLPYFVLPVLPWLFPNHAAEAAVAILVLGQVPNVVFSTAWSPLLADVIPRNKRSIVISWRNIFSSGVVALGIYLAGLWLDAHAFPGNYQWMYLAGALLGGVSTYMIGLIETPPEKKNVPTHEKRESIWVSIKEITFKSHGFSTIILDTLFFNIGAWMLGPLFTIFCVRELGASDGWVGVNGMISNIGVLLGYFIWQRIMRKFGENRTLLIAAPLMCLQAFLMALWPNLGFILFISFLLNLLGSGVNLSHSMIWFDLMPPEKKYSATAVYSMVMNAGAFIGPMLGVWLADEIGLLNTIIVSGVLRLLGAGMFFLFPLRPKEPANTTAQ